MSGVEAAGLALAVFPILLSALENYRETAEVVSDWWRFKRKWLRCKRDIEYHQIAFASNLEQLLLPLVCDDDQINSLMSDPGGAGWHQEALNAKLRDRLPNAFEAYMNSIHEISEVMSKLTQELGLDKECLIAKLRSRAETAEAENAPGMQKVTTKQSLDYQFHRIKFALSQSNREKLFQEFTKYNDRLRDLLKTADKVTSLRKDRLSNDRSPTASMLKQFWRHAGTLYKLLSKAFNCQCRDSHHVDLQLQHRTVPDIEFNIMFIFSLISGHERPWSWRDTKIKMLKPAKEAVVKLPVQPKSMTATTHSIEGMQKVSILQKFKKTVSIDNQASFSSTSTLVASSISPKKAVGWHDQDKALIIPKTKEIGNLCNALTDRPCNEQECLGMLTHEEDCYTMHPADHSTEVLDVQERLTLKDLLERKHGISLTRRQRYQIALTIASSQVQLQSTPWLRSKWDKKDIIFFRNKMNPGAILFDRPRLSRDVEHEKAGENEKEQTADRSITTLGILLLELCFGTTLESNPIRARYPVPGGQPNPYLDLAAALEWSEQVNEEAGPEYFNAISWCLKSNRTNATNDEWRMELYENVVKPLHECYQHLV